MHRFWLTGEKSRVNLEMYREALANLSEELIALVLAQAAQIETLTAQIED